MDKSRQIILYKQFNNGIPIIKIVFDIRDTEITELVKSIPNRKWSKQGQFLFTENTPENLKAIFNLFRGVAWVDASSVFKKSINQIKREDQSSKGARSLVLSAGT